MVPKRSKFFRAAHLCSLLTLLSLAACTSRTIKFINPHTGASATCSASGFGIGASFGEGFVSGCSRAYQERGYVQLDQLTPEQRKDLAGRGLLPQQ